MENKEKNSVSELMETTMTKIREMVDSNSVIGEPAGPMARPASASAAAAERA